MSDPARSRSPQFGELGGGFTPAAWPQPGIASIYPAYPEGAEIPLEAPRTRDPNPTVWHDHALCTALGMQMAIGHPHIRAMLGDLIDKAMRLSFKPVALPPWIEKPFRAEYFGTRVVQSGAVAHSDTAWTSISDGTRTMEYEIPEGYMGVIKEFGHSVEDPTNWDEILWRITVNDLAVAPFINVGCQIAQISDPKKITIIAPGGSTVKVQVQVPFSVGSSRTGMGAWCLGWIWPMAMDGDVDNASGQSTVA